MLCSSILPLRGKDCTLYRLVFHTHSSHLVNMNVVLLDYLKLEEFLCMLRKVCDFLKVHCVALWKEFLIKRKIFID